MESLSSRLEISSLVPYPLAMVVCDGLWRDPYTGKTTIIGTFSTIGGAKFPLRHPVLSLYISLTDGRGRVPMKLVLIDVDEEREAVFEVDDELDFKDDPRMIVELCLVQMNLIFEEPGEYRLKLFVKDEFLMERRILVAQSEPQRAKSSEEERT